MGEHSGMLPGFLLPACNQILRGRVSRPHGQAVSSR
jgi:hypothetical protein